MAADSTAEILQTDWSKYYEVGASSFAQRTERYKNAIRRLREQVPVFLSGSRKTFLLGGFVPSNGTPQSFDELCRGVHDNSADKHIYLDLNRQPFKSSGDRPGVQADLRKLPFREESIDIIFLDGTTDLMDEQAIQDFAEGAARVLTKNGVIIISKLPKGMAEHQIKNIPVLKTSIKLYPRDDSDLARLLGGHLKPVYHQAGIFDVDRGYDAGILAFARANSDFDQVDITGPDPQGLSRISFKTSP